METNSGPLIEQGIALTAASYAALLDQAAWRHAQVDRTICHQVGARPRKLMLQALSLDCASDITTYETLGNTGATAIPLTMAIAVEQERIRPGDRIALLGNGSGVSALLLAVDWRQSILAGDCGQSGTIRRAASKEGTIVDDLIHGYESM
jgi:3-oxoacyl-[acyl-carrier-protein] synthase-3